MVISLACPRLFRIAHISKRERDFYAPNSEILQSDEMRVIACGTGMPIPRPAQAAACFLVELGNRERMAIVNHHGWSPPAAYAPIPVSASDGVVYSPEIEAGRHITWMMPLSPFMKKQGKH